MTDKLYIDGADAFTAYGIFVSNGGYAGVVEWPALKTVDSNDWPEDDGIDADLSEPRLDTKEFSMSFCCVDADKTYLLFEHLTDGAYHEFEFKPIGLIKNLRLVSQPNVNTIIPLQAFTLNLVDDFPLENYAYQEPAPISSCWQKGFQIDGRELSDYGVWVLDGTLDEILKAPAVKGNLKVNTSNIAGSIYEDTDVRFQPKDVNIKCLLKAESSEVFWHNYNALLYDLTRPTERMVYMAESGELFSCYYKNSKVSQFAVIAGVIWCEFTITLCLVSARPGQVEYLLAAENGRLIITENSTENYNVFINVKRNEN